MGKTTLWRAREAAARARGHELLETRPAEAEAAFAFAGLGDLLGGVLDEVLDGLPEPQGDTETHRVPRARRLGDHARPQA